MLGCNPLELELLHRSSFTEVVHRFASSSESRELLLRSLALVISLCSLNDDLYQIVNLQRLGLRLPGRQRS